MEDITEDDASGVVRFKSNGITLRKPTITYEVTFPEGTTVEQVEELLRELGIEYEIRDVK